MIHLFHKKKKKEDIPKWIEEGVTLYSCKSDLDKLISKIEDSFWAIQRSCDREEENHLTIQLKDESLINFHITTKADEMEAQAKGMANFFSQVPLEQLEVREIILQQIRMFKSSIGIRFQVNEDTERTQLLLGMIHRLAKSLDAFILYPSMELYHFDGRLVLSLDGRSDYQGDENIFMLDTEDKTW